jgi:hypothetical protein
VIVTAQPADQRRDPRDDPEEILARLPERGQLYFLEEYRAAAEAAREPSGYRQLRELLNSWYLRSIAYSQPDFWERMEDVKAGRGEYIPMEEVIARYNAEHGTSIAIPR